MNRPRHILFTTSTFPISDTDPVPAFIKDEAIWLKKVYPELKISILAPHSAYSPTSRFSQRKHYNEYRFHYFWPFRLELLSGRGISPALKKNKLLYFQLPGLFIAEFFATLKYTRELKPDLIYAHWFTPQAITGALVSKITGTKFVFDTQASDVIVLKNVPFAKKIVASVCNKAFAYTAPSQQTIDKLVYFTSDKNREKILNKLHKIPYGTVSVPTSNKAIDDVRKKYNLKGKKVIYFIGRLVDRKGADILIKSFSDMYKKDQTLRLVIVGDGPERTNLETLAKELTAEKGVIFTGFLSGEERYALLSITNVAAIPSINVGDHAEGLPIVFMEALTYGKAIVLTDATGAHEFVEDGKNAFVVKAGSAKQLREKLYLALELDASQDKNFFKAIKKLSEKFQWPNIVKQRYKAFSLDKN